jgi:hypothetical protein
MNASESPSSKPETPTPTPPAESPISTPTPTPSQPEPPELVAEPDYIQSSTLQNLRASTIEPPPKPIIQENDLKEIVGATPAIDKVRPTGSRKYDRNIETMRLEKSNKELIDLISAQHLAEIVEEPDAKGRRQLISLTKVSENERKRVLIFLQERFVECLIDPARCCDADVRKTFLYTHQRYMDVLKVLVELYTR